MPQIQVSIAGRTYRMACGEGEEAHLEGLAADFDGRVGEMRTQFGEIGDMRLHVMAALTLLDELAEEKKKAAALEDEIAAQKAVAAADLDRTERQVSEQLGRAAERIERMARGLAGSGRVAAPVA